MRAFSYFRSRNKDGGHAVADTSPLFVLQTPSYWRWNVHTAGMRICAGTQVSVARIMDGRRPFCSCDLDLHPMTFWHFACFVCLCYHIMWWIKLNIQAYRQTDWHNRATLYTRPLRAWSASGDFINSSTQRQITIDLNTLRISSNVDDLGW